MLKHYFLSILLLITASTFSQNYTSYYTGNATNVTTTPQGGVCLMGGATENDEAMKWFLQRANGGDVLVLRATGSNGYNTYMYSTLGITVNSVETIVCNNAAASNEAYVQQKIQQAEAIWFAGGNQWTYISYWRNTAIASLINTAIANRNIVVGGTSAGMAILGRTYYSAQNGSATSASALSNPYSSTVTPDSTNFLKVNYLDSVITDTHYDNPDRRGRHTTFLARMKTDWNWNIKGIACDEYTAVCIDNTGLAKVYGGFPTSDDNAYFIQSNCEVNNNLPETCVANTALTWNQGNQALKVYAVKGTITGSNTFNVADWKIGIGGTWQRWYVVNGVWQTATTSAINCVTLPILLSSFTAVKNKQQTLLSWQTSTEQNGSHFNIQKSKDGVSFTTIASVAAVGNSSALQHYQFEDKTPYVGIKNYYRLQLVDIDGKFVYSKTAVVNFDKQDAMLIYPNPVKSSSAIWVLSNISFLQKAIITNVTGQKVKEQNFTNNQSHQLLNIIGLQAGVYFLNIFGTGISKTKTTVLVIEQ